MSPLETSWKAYDSASSVSKPEDSVTIRTFHNSLSVIMVPEADPIPRVIPFVAYTWHTDSFYSAPSWANFMRYGDGVLTSLWRSRKLEIEVLSNAVEAWKYSRSISAPSDIKADTPSRPHQWAHVTLVRQLKSSHDMSVQTRVN